MKTNDEHSHDARLAALRAMPYHDYLQTVEWRRCRDRALVRASWRCAWHDCRERYNLEVHHRTYERLGEERDDDVQVLCPRHHRGRHDHLDTLRRVHWRVIRDVIQSGPYALFADFAAAVKDRFQAEHLTVDWRDLNEMLAVSLRDVSLPVPHVPMHGELRKDTAPLISHREARELLESLNLGAMADSMAMARAAIPDLRTDDDFEAARERAYEMGIELSREEFFR